MTAIKTTENRPSRGTVPTLKRVTTLVTLGNVLEWYDFTIYGFLAPYIALTFFPSEDPFAALLTTFAVFAVGFVARPIGALVLGPLIDRKGRKAVMLVSMLLMAGGSLLIGVAPSYLVAGSLGAALVVVGRLAQGFSAGGEHGSSAIFLVEWAHEGRRGFFGSFHQIATYGGLLLGVLLTAGMTSILGTSTMSEWAWRVPFILGAFLAVVVFIMRRSLEETPVFAVTNLEPTGTPDPKDPTVEEPSTTKGFFLAIGVVALWGVTAMVTLTYMPSYATNFLGISSQSALWATVIGAGLAVVLLPVAGLLSDKFGRKALIMAGAIGYLLLPYPLFLLMATTTSFWSVALTQAVLALFSAAIAGVGPSTIVELFSTRHRGSKVSIASAIAITIFGGFGTYICTWLIGATGSNISPAFYISSVAGITLLTALFLPRHLASRPLRK